MSESEKDQVTAELAALEREWDADQARYLIRGADGEFQPPAPINIARCIMLMVGSVVGMALLAATSLPSFVALVGLIPFGIGTFRLMVGSSKAEALERCRTAYESRRAALLRKLGGNAGIGEFR
jgi:hypothetical protein